MLLYNYKQEFIGIDDEELHLLNYSSLEELLSVCSDVADLFANEPGYIHNFKNFGWINFLLHA
ncbi:MAG: Hpt domain-containing protein, partial [Sulfuricurvum sp.]|nr:Hpt domain-containing protein [Sulfuricurvum sp.]